MKFKSISMTALILFGSIFGQSESLEIEDAEPSTSLQGAFGAVTIDGKIWNQIALRPTLPFGKLSVAFDMVLYIDQDGNIHDDDWDFSSGEKVKNTIIDKIYYIRYGNRWDKNYFKIGALDNVTMGYGILLNRYTNTLLYPQVRKVGMEFKTRALVSISMVLPMILRRIWVLQASEYLLQLITELPQEYHGLETGINTLVFVIGMAMAVLIW